MLGRPKRNDLNVVGTENELATPLVTYEKPLKAPTGGRCIAGYLWTVVDVSS
jgi:hypothetical protein